MKINILVVLCGLFLIGSSQMASAQKPELDIQTGHLNGVRTIAFSPDGKFLASGSGDNTVKLWNFETGDEMRTFTGHGNSVKLVVFSQDGRLLASHSDDDTIKIWNVMTGKLEKNFIKDASSVWSMAFSSDKKFLAS